jgi:hypothetical protein
MARFGRSQPASPFLNRSRNGVGTLRTLPRYGRIEGTVLDGTVTPSGTDVQQVQQLLAGVETPSGQLANSSSRTSVGTETPVGTFAKNAVKPLAGSESPTGSVVKRAAKILSGSATAAGTLTRRVSRSLSGSSSPTGSLRTLITKLLSGTETPTGTLTVFVARFNTAAALRLRAGTVTLHRLASIAATAVRTRAGRAFPQTINPATSGAMSVRWRFDDLSTGASYVFEINPLSGGSPSAKRTITSTATTAADGDPVSFEGDSELPTGEFAGTVRSQAQYDAFKTWLATRRPVQLTDDLLRRSIIVILRVSPKRKYTPKHPAKREVTVTYRILEQTDV